jgi:hypothetical protein
MHGWQGACRKRDKPKKVEEKLTPKFLSIFLGKVFDMDFLQKYFGGIFELPLPRNAQKRALKGALKKKLRERKNEKKVG